MLRLYAELVSYITVTMHHIAATCMTLALQSSRDRGRVALCKRDIACVLDVTKIQQRILFSSRLLVE